MSNTHEIDSEILSILNDIEVDFLLASMCCGSILEKKVMPITTFNNSVVRLWHHPNSIVENLTSNTCGFLIIGVCLKKTEKSALSYQYTPVTLAVMLNKDNLLDLFIYYDEIEHDEKNENNIAQKTDEQINKSIDFVCKKSEQERGKLIRDVFNCGKIIRNVEIDAFYYVLEKELNIDITNAPQIYPKIQVI